MKIRVIVAATVGLALVALAVAAPAAADTAPVLACGSTITISCSQTAHFSDVDSWLTPSGPGTNCPPYVANDFGLQVGTGNGIEHNNINKAGDFWTTNTFTGKVTITFYDRSNVDVTVDDQGNIVEATPTGPPENEITGHMTQWFGVSENRQSLTFGLTFTVTGVDQAGAPVTIHGEQHQNWTPGSVPFADPARNAKAKLSC
jgi:hypothetical protein